MGMKMKKGLGAHQQEWGPGIFVLPLSATVHVRRNITRQLVPVVVVVEEST